MRQRIDITDMEVRTKIRAKYLRALENEEWDLLPGPTYVKSFLRTYAEALGLDPKLLVEEYKLRHDRARDRRPAPDPPADARATAGAAQRAAARRAALGDHRRSCSLLILGALFADRPGGRRRRARDAARATPDARRPSSTASGERARARARRRRRRRVRLTVAPTAAVWVCLVNARRRPPDPGDESSRRARRARSARAASASRSATAACASASTARPSSRRSRPSRRATSSRSNGRRTLGEDRAADLRGAT